VFLGYAGVENLLQSLAFFLAFKTLGNADVSVTRQIDQVA